MPESHIAIVAHEPAVPSSPQKLESPKRSSMVAYGASFEKHAVRVLAHAWLGQCEALVHVAVKQTQHFATESVAGVFDTNVAR